MGFFTKNNLKDKGSSIFLLKDSRISIEGFVSERVIPREITNFLIASGKIPLLFNPFNVGSLGSSHLCIIPLSIKCVIFLLETGIPQILGEKTLLNLDVSI